MFKFLQEMDGKLYQRYLTLERNIKAGSNSFYDAYLDLQEQFVKTVALDAGIEFRVRDSVGDLLRKNELKEYFLQTLGVEEYTYNKMQDYTLKVNEHKHKGEKNIQVETIVNYMRVIYCATSGYARYKSVATSEFDGNYFIGLFGCMERENESLKNEMNILKEELSASVEQGKLKDSDILAYKGLLSVAELDKLSLEEQNEELHRQISKLKDIKLSSMEEKLNKTIDLLHQLGDSVVENRAIAYAVGDTICGREVFERYVDKTKNVWNKAKKNVDKVNDSLETSVSIAKRMKILTNSLMGSDDE